MIVGYCRVSSSSQSLDVQLEELSGAGCVRIFSDVQSAVTMVNRPSLNEMLSFIRSGDTVVVSRLDRLARNVAELHAILDGLGAMGVGFRCLKQEAVDTGTASGRMMMSVLAAVAVFENDLRRERQREGIARAQARGVYKGRAPVISQKVVCQLRSNGLGVGEICSVLKVSRSSVYRHLAAAKLGGKV